MLETAMTSVSRASSAPSAALRSRSALAATLPRSDFVTTRTSGISMIPAFRNCSTSAEQGPARALGRWVHRQHRDRVAARAPPGHELGQQRRLAGPGRPRDPHDVRRRLAAEDGGGDLAQERGDFIAATGGAVLDQVED